MKGRGLHRTNSAKLGLPPKHRRLSVVVHSLIVSARVTVKSRAHARQVLALASAGGDGPVVFDIAEDEHDDSEDEDDDDSDIEEVGDAFQLADFGQPSQPVERKRAQERSTAAEDESDKYYQGLLTSADVAADPPGHKSGYVAIIGRPNAGKSTLLNALVGQKLSIVSHKAQTTRHRVLGIVSDDAYQMVLLDTPGVIDERRNRLEGRMMAYVKSAMREADAIVTIVDASYQAQDVLSMVQPPADYSGPPMLVVLNKQDRLSSSEASEMTEWWRANCRCDAVLTTTANQGLGVDAVKEWMATKLPLGPTLYPKQLVSEHPERFFVSEIIREHVFHSYSEEVPYCVQVNVLDFKERKAGKDYIQCELVCERATQKGILLGAGGSAIKAVASAARADIEQFLGRSVYLDVKVRVDTAWRENVGSLKSFGY